MENESLEEKRLETMGMEVEQEVLKNIDEVSDSGITQLKYFFSSWSKYFKSISVKPTFLVFFALIFVLILALTPFREAQKEYTIESTRITLEDTFNNNSLYQELSEDDIDALVEQSLNTVENMYSAPIFILTNVVVAVSGFLMTFVCVLVVLKISKSTITVKQMLAVTVGATVISSITNLVYGISINFTGSLTNIMSLGIFAVEAPITSTAFVLLNSITIATVITFMFYYYMCTQLSKFSKNKSLIVSLVLIIVPIIITVGPTLLVNMLM